MRMDAGPARAACAATSTAVKAHLLQEEILSRIVDAIRDCVDPRRRAGNGGAAHRRGVLAGAQSGGEEDRRRIRSLPPIAVSTTPAPKWRSSDFASVLDEIQDQRTDAHRIFRQGEPRTDRAGLSPRPCERRRACRARYRRRCLERSGTPSAAWHRRSVRRGDRAGEQLRSARGSLADRRTDGPAEPPRLFIRWSSPASCISAGRAVPPRYSISTSTTSRWSTTSWGTRKATACSRKSGRSSPTNRAPAISSARIGGDEFLLWLEDTEVDGAGSRRAR